MGNTDGASVGKRASEYPKEFLRLLSGGADRGGDLLGCMVSPPSLMDDVDAVQAQIARNMLTSGDWVTARLDGVPYLEKAPLIYWLMAICVTRFSASTIGPRAFPWCWRPSRWPG